MKVLLFEVLRRLKIGGFFLFGGKMIIFFLINITLRYYLIEMFDLVFWNSIILMFFFIIFYFYSVLLGKYKYKFEYKLVKKVSRDINRIVIIYHYRSTSPFYSIFIYNIFSYHPTKIFKVIKLFFARFKYVISISCREDPIKPAKIPHFQTELKTFVQKETTLQTEKELFTEQWIKETKKITIKKKEIEMRERKTKNELKQSLTLITQQSKFRLQRRGWRSRGEDFSRILFSFRFFLVRSARQSALSKSCTAQVSTRKRTRREPA